jgi:hypothetical protein
MMEKESLPVLVLNQWDVAMFKRVGINLSGYDVREPQSIPVPPPAPRVLTGQPQGPARQRTGRELRRAEAKGRRRVV